MLPAKTAKPEANLIEVPDNLNDLSVDERIAFTDELNQALQDAKIELRIPYESDCERMAADFDGDCIGIAEAELFPNLTQDVIEKSKPENLFRPTRKEAKLSFPDGTDFEVMAIHMADSISVGSIPAGNPRIIPVHGAGAFVQKYLIRTVKFPHFSKLFPLVGFCSKLNGNP
jgi:hypothetical protein